MPGLDRAAEQASFDAVQPAFLEGVTRFGDLVPGALRAWARWEAAEGITRARPTSGRAFALGFETVSGGRPAGWISWTAQALPSGSLKKTKRPHGKSCDLADLDAAAGQLGVRGVDVVDDELQALHRAGPASVMPCPIAIEHAEPGGVSCTKRSLVADRVVVVGVEAAWST